MRDIKFRAWDKTRNIYGQVLKLETPYSELDMGFCGHAGRVSLFNVKNETDCGFWGCWIEKVELEQYTGLKDKNGKEIYEGDIINILEIFGETGAEFGPFLGEVVFLYGKFELQLTKEWAGNKTIVLYTPYDTRGEEMEVIGNIHENPELLSE